MILILKKLNTEQNIKKIRTKSTEIWLDEEGVLWVRFDPDAELELDEVIECFDTYKKMGINKDNKVLQIIDAQEGGGNTKEGRDYAALYGKEFFIASAIISKKLAVRLIVNFFNAYYKFQKVPFKLFDTEENAKKWLYNFRK